MINNDAQALQALRRHLARGKTGHPHAVRRYCQRGLDLQQAPEYFVYLSHKAYLTWGAGRAMTVPFNVLKRQVESQSGGTLSSIIVVHDEIQVGVVLPGTVREVIVEGMI